MKVGSSRKNPVASQLAWRDIAMVAIKTVHSTIFLLNAASVLHVLCVGVLNRRSRWTRLARCAR
jgi:hypothetical protein